jgi:hypothetical protein
MAKNKISEWSAVPANNTDVGGIDIAEGCAPSGINNAIREMMAQIKDQQTGTDADSFTVGGALVVTGNTTLSNTLTVNSSVGTAGQALVSRGAGLSPEWGSGFPSGGIIIWSGSSGLIPSGWLLCDGSNSTPDLRNRFVVGATSTYAVGATGGSANAIVVAHTHTGTTSTAGAHRHYTKNSLIQGQQSNSGEYRSTHDNYNQFLLQDATREPNTGLTTESGNHNHTFTTDSTGSSGTNANLPPYYALCYIMKS